MSAALGGGGYGTGSGGQNRDSYSGIGVSKPDGTYMGGGSWKNPSTGGTKTGGTSGVLGGGNKGGTGGTSGTGGISGTIKTSGAKGTSSSGSATGSASEAQATPTFVLPGAGTNGGYSAPPGSGVGRAPSRVMVQPAADNGSDLPLDASAASVVSSPSETPNRRAEALQQQYAQYQTPPGLAKIDMDYPEYRSYSDGYDPSEAILGVEDVPMPASAPPPPPSAPPVAETPQPVDREALFSTPPPPGLVYDKNPVQYDPKHTWQGKVLGNVVDGLMRVLPMGSGTMANMASKHFNQGLTAGDLAQRDLDGYLGADPQARAAYNQRATARRAADTARENSTNRIYLPSQYDAPPQPVAAQPTSALAAAAPAPQPPTQSSGWQLPTRNQNPSDPYNYGLGPGYNFFNYG